MGKMTSGENLIQLPADAKTIKRDHVERVARIMGEKSAAADALRRADEYDGPVRFWYSESTKMLSVEPIKSGDKEHLH